MRLRDPTPIRSAPEPPPIIGNHRDQGRRMTRLAGDIFHGPRNSVVLRKKPPDRALCDADILGNDPELDIEPLLRVNTPAIDG